MRPTLRELHRIAKCGLPRPDVEVQVQSERELALDALSMLRAFEDIRRLLARVEVVTATVEADGLCREQLKGRSAIPPKSAEQIAATKATRRRAKRKARTTNLKGA